MTATPGVARFRNPQGGAVGGGVLVVGNLVLTCAHVVNSALGRPPGTVDAPHDERINLDFPLTGGGAVEASVVVWSHLSRLGHGDIALLKLAATAGATPAALSSTSAASEDLSLFGFPRGRPDGVWKRDIVCAGPMVGGWLQLGVRGTGGYRFQAGFSGCPVFDPDGRVLGILAQAENDPSVDVAAFIPVSVLSSDLAAAAGHPVLPIQAEPTAVADATTVFIGRTRRGFHQPMLLTEWDDYRRAFGEPLDPADSYLGAAVQGFFDNGGQLAYVVRTADVGAAVASVSIPTTDPGQALIVSARSSGAWANGFRIEIGEGSRRGARVILSPSSGQVEDYDNLSTHPDGPNPLTDAVRSDHVSFAWATALPPAAPERGSWALAGGADGASPIDDQIGDIDQTLRSLGEGLVCVPDADHPRYQPDDRGAARQRLVRACEAAQCLALLGLGPDEPDLDSASAAAFHPPVLVRSSNGETIPVSPVGHVAGAIARHDAEIGVHRSIAGTAVRDAVVAVPVPDADVLIRRGINPLIAGVVGSTFGASQTCAVEEDRRDLAKRRTYLMVSRAIEVGTRWTLFEESNEATWQKAADQAKDYLHGLWERGVLSGATPDEAFFVACGRDTMTQDDIDNRRLIMQFYLAVGDSKPTEGSM